MKSLAIFPTTATTGDSSTPEGNAAGGSDGSLWQSLKRVQRQVTGRWLGDGGEEHHPQHHQDERRTREEQMAEAQRALEGDEDPLEWARAARDRDRDAFEGGGGGVGGEDEDGDDRHYWAGDDDMLETLVIIGLCLGFGCVDGVPFFFMSVLSYIRLAFRWLVYYRQARQEAAQAERRRAEQEAAQREHVAAAGSRMAAAAAAVVPTPTPTTPAPMTPAPAPTTPAPTTPTRTTMAPETTNVADGSAAPSSSSSTRRDQGNAEGTAATQGQ
jgi:hypothetical protein